MQKGYCVDVALLPVTWDGDVKVQRLFPVGKNGTFCTGHQFDDTWRGKRVLVFRTDFSGCHQTCFFQHRKVLGGNGLANPCFDCQFTDAPWLFPKLVQQEDTYGVCHSLAHMCCQFTVHSLLFRHEHIVAMLGNVVKSPLDNVE